MTTPTPLPLDAAALEPMLRGTSFTVKSDDIPKLIAQSRAALTLAARVAELERGLAEARENAKAWESEADSANALGQSWMAHANALRDALEAAPILIREAGEYGREWLSTDRVGTTFGHWDGWYRKRNAALAAHPAASLAAHDAEVRKAALLEVAGMAWEYVDASDLERAIRALAAQAQEVTK